MAGAVLPSNRLLADDCASAAAEITRLKKALRDREYAHLPQMIGYLKRLREKFGPGVVEEVKSVTIEQAKRGQVQRKLAPEQRTLDVVVKDYASWTDAIDYQWVEQSPQRLVARVTRCRWAEEMKKLGAEGDLGFAIICASDYGYCAGLNPAIRFSRTKTLMQGDDHCNHTYELKS
jgi:hypothetical protein